MFYFVFVHRSDQDEKDKLKKQIYDLHNRIDREIQMTTLLTLERDKIERFWLLEKDSRDELTNQFRNKLRQKQDLEEKHLFEKKVYKQKVRYLLHEMQGHMTDVRIDGQVALKLLQDDTRDNQHELKSNLRSIKVRKKQLELAHYDLIRNIKQETEDEIMQSRQTYERMAEELKQSYVEKMKTVILLNLITIYIYIPCHDI